MVSAPPKEYHVLTSYNAKLVKTVKTDINNLLPYLVAANVIQDGDEEYIRSIPRSSDRVSELLRHISGPVNSGFTSSFYTMLKIMCDHGNDTTKQLAKEIEQQVESSQSNSEGDDDDDDDDYDCDDSTTLSHLQRKRTAKDVSRSGREMEKLGRSSAKKRKQGTSPMQNQGQDDRQQQSIVESDEENASGSSNNKTEKFSLFISYTHKDNTNNFAQKLHDNLTEEGWEVFIDTENIGIGDELPAKIVAAINKCHGMIVILTNNYYESKWCPKEVDLADSKKKKLYPLFREKLDDDHKPSSVDLHINTTRLLYGSFCEEDKYDESLKQLTKCIREDAKKLGFF